MTTSRNQDRAVNVESKCEHPSTQQLNETESSTLVRQSTSETTHDMPAAKEKLPTPLITYSLVGEKIREVRLHRTSDFQGYGFHLMYNKAYFSIISIEPNSPAEKSDLRINDVVLLVNDQLTQGMSNATFVKIVSQSQHVTLFVQDRDEYLRHNPLPPARNHSNDAIHPEC